MKPSGVITITTDFGHQGPFAAVMHGVILDRFADAKVIDLAHDIPAQWPPEAGFWVSRSYRYFPRGTVHLAIVDPGVGTERDILIVEHDDHYFMAPDNGLLARLLDTADAAAVFKLDPGVGTERNILIIEHDGHVFLAPDNGLLGLLLGRADDASVMHLDLSKLPSLGIVDTSATFHGRDIFAPVAAELAAGNITAADVGSPTMDWIPSWLDEPEVSDGKVKGAIVTVDAFGNLISNIDAGHVQGFTNPVASIGGHEFTMNETYGRVQPGDYLALINSFGVVEIARAEGDAAEGLGLERGAPITVRDSG